MFKFVKKFLLVIFISGVSIFMINSLTIMINSQAVMQYIFYIIDKSGKNSGLPAVVLGDSVCGQLWPGKRNSEHMAHLSNNQAITVCGNYLLLKKYLENNPQTKEAYYAIVPSNAILHGNLADNFNPVYSYQYFVIPFLNDENLKLLEKETITLLYQKFGRLFVENSYIKDSLKGNKFFMKQYMRYLQRQPRDIYVHRISPTAAIYLRKMQELCRSHNVKFFVRPLPVSDLEENYGWEDFERDVKTLGFEDILGDFVKRIKYYPEDWFFDKVHFKREILETHGDEIRALILQQ